MNENIEENIEDVDEDVDEEYKKITKKNESPFHKEQKELDKEEKSLPDENNMSMDQIRAVQQSRKMSFEDILPLIGSNKFYLDWHITITRTKPTRYKGKNVPIKKIDKIDIGMEYKELTDRLEEQHGGGAYKVQLFDERGTPRRQKTIKVDGNPRFDKEKYFELFDGKGDSDDYLHDEKLRLERERIKNKQMKEKREMLELEKEMEKISRGDSDKKSDSDMAVLTAMTSIFTKVLEQQNLNSQRIEQRIEQNKRESDERTERLITQLSEKKDDGGTNQMEMFRIISDQQNKSNEMMMNVMKEIQESNRKSIEQTQNSTNQNINQVLELIKSKSEQSESVTSILDIVSQAEFHKQDNVIKLLEVMLPLLSSQSNDPNSKIMDAVLQLIGKGGDLISLAGKMKNKKAIPQKSSPSVQQTEAPAGKKKKKQEVIPLTNKEKSEIFNSFDEVDDNQKIVQIIVVLLRDSASMPSPDKSLFVKILTEKDIPEFIRVFIHDEIDSAKDFKNAMNDLLGEEDNKTLNSFIFSVPERMEWLENCLNYIQTYETDSTDVENEKEDHNE